MKLYVDDIREAPAGWHRVRTATEAIRTIYYSGSIGEEITDISLDHDISHPVTVGSLMRPYPCEETYASVAYFIGLFYREYAPLDKPKVTIHSSNIVGAENMQLILARDGIHVDIKLSPPVFRKQPPK